MYMSTLWYIMYLWVHYDLSCIYEYIMITPAVATFSFGMTKTHQLWWPDFENWTFQLRVKKWEIYVLLLHKLKILPYILSTIV